MRLRIKTMLSVWAGLIAVATMGAPAATATTATATTATATTATAAQDTFLVLGVQAGGGDRFVTLRCGDPPSGTHPNPEGACKVLGDAGGDVTKIPGQPSMRCPNIYDPVTAIASGDYQGGKVIFRHTYPNRCDLARHTAPVFEL